MTLSRGNEKRKIFINNEQTDAGKVILLSLLLHYTGNFIE